MRNENVWFENKKKTKKQISASLYYKLKGVLSYFTQFKFLLHFFILFYFTKFKFVW